MLDLPVQAAYLAQAAGGGRWVTHEIVATLTNTNAVGDNEVLAELLEQVPEPID